MRSISKGCPVWLHSGFWTKCPGLWMEVSFRNYLVFVENPWIIDLILKKIKIIKLSERGQNSSKTRQKQRKFGLYRLFFFFNEWTYLAYQNLGRVFKLLEKLLWSSGEGQARIGKGWQSRQKASKLKPEPRAYIKVGCHHHPPTTTTTERLILLN